jgi:predicted nuclease of restriction endonuclease-like (RecB) superfamily
VKVACPVRRGAVGKAPALAGLLACCLPDFLDLSDDAREREVEQALLEHLTRFMLELGKGFAFVGRQYPMEVGGEAFYLDLLFYHLKLHGYVAIELKTGAFKPEYAGKLNFYLTALDRADSL